MTTREAEGKAEQGALWLLVVAACVAGSLTACALWFAGEMSETSARSYVEATESL